MASPFEPSQNRRESVLTRTSAFKKLTKWAFNVCANDDGHVSKSELYSGILLVHLNLAKYAGAAACYPPTRAVVEELFYAFDDDHSGYIDEEEFTQIMMICSSQIAGRILVYYVILILMVPYLAQYFVTAVLHVDDIFGWHMTKTGIFHWIESIMTWHNVAEKFVGLALFFLVVPFFFNWIDSESTVVARKTVVTKSKEKSV